MLGDQTGDTDRGKQLFQETLYRPPLPGSGQGGSPATECLWPTAGSISTFKYSDALKSAHVTWDDVSLDKWLTETESLVPNNDMRFHLPKADERADIIRFLKASAGK